MALFGSTTVGSTGGQTHLVEMKAGKMFQKENWIYPDKRKGFLYVYQTSESLMHFCWRDRSKDEAEDDLIVFPGECTYSRVQECTTGRVYLLKFNKSSLRLFYWLQEPKTDKDDQHCRRINQVLNSPNTSTQGAYGFSQSQLSRIFGPNIAATLSSLMNQEGTSTNIEQTKPGSPNDENVMEIPIISEIATTASESQKEVSNVLDATNGLPKNSENTKNKKKSVTILDDVTEVKDIVENNDPLDQEEDGVDEKTEESSRNSENMDK